MEKTLQEITLAYSDGKSLSAFRRDDGTWEVQPESQVMTASRQSDPSHPTEADLAFEITTALCVSAGIVQPR